MWFADRLRAADPLSLFGAYDALSAVCLEAAGVEAIYLGSYALTASSLGKPDIGMLSFGEVLDICRRVREATSLPIVADADTGYGGPNNVARTVRELGRIGIAAVQIEDQVNPKRCGHIVGKAVVPIDEAAARVSAAVQAGREFGLAVIARTDALAVEGLDSAIRRCQAFERAGAAATFVDAYRTLDEVAETRARVDAPIVFNAADTGVSPPLSSADAVRLGIGAVLYPVQVLFAAWRAVRDHVTELRQLDTSLPPPGSDGRDFHALNSLLGLPHMVAWEKTLIGGIS